MGETMTGAGGLPFETLRWSGGELYLLDQTRLPAELVEERQGSAERVWESIRALKVRGAPAIGVAAAYGLALGLRERRGASFPAFLDEARRIAAYLASARPTAVNLEWALRRMVGFAEARAARSASVPALYEALVGEAIRIHEEDKATCRAIGEAGACLVAEGSGILTHCNAGALATTGIGTATAPLYLAHAAGRRFRVYADETRPLLQGARLTAWELSRSGLDVTLLCEGMAAHALSKGLVQLCIVGCDRVAANGDAANKIGTLGLAVLARHFGVPFYVACPSSTLDLATPRGEDIVIEERDPAEVTSLGGRRVAPQGVRALNPAFDVTPRELISGFVTEAGILRPPFEEGFRALAGER